MLTFVVHVRRTSEVLARVVLLFHGRRIEIDSLAAGRAEGSDVLRIEVTLEGDQIQAGLIEARLYRLADVLLVEQSDPSMKARNGEIQDGHREP
jgi:acetolactate synthase small subunit